MQKIQHIVKQDFRGKTSFTDGWTSTFRLKTFLYCFWCTINLHSYYISQINDCALALLRRPERHLSIQYQTDTQACLSTYTALAQRHCACVREALPYFPSTWHESQNLFHFAFSLWFQRNLAKIKQQERYKNYRKGLCRIEWKYCYGNVQEKLK